MVEWTFLDVGLAAALVHFKSLHLMTDDLVMMTVIQVKKADPIFSFDQPSAPIPVAFQPKVKIETRSYLK